jgi:hypothetical protein
MGQVRVLHVPSSRQFADILTKGLPSPLFLDFGPVSTSVLLPLRLRGSVRDMSHYVI